MFVGFSSHSFYTLPTNFIYPVPELLNSIIMTADTTAGKEALCHARSGRSRVPRPMARAWWCCGSRSRIELIKLPHDLLKSNSATDVATSSDTDGGLGELNHTCRQFSCLRLGSIDQPWTDGFRHVSRAGRLSCTGWNSTRNSSRGTCFSVFRLSGGGDTIIPLRLIRPPVALIHGLWGNSLDWNIFAPGLKQSRAFSVLDSDLTKDLWNQIDFTDPAYSQSVSAAKENSLGFGVQCRASAGQNGAGR